MGTTRFSPPSSHRRSARVAHSHIGFVERRTVGSRGLAFRDSRAGRAARTRALRFSWPSQPQRGLHEQWQFAGLSTSSPASACPLATFPLKIPKAGTGTLAEASRLFHGVVARRGKRKQKLIRDRFGVGVEGRER